MGELSVTDCDRFEVDCLPLIVTVTDCDGYGDKELDDIDCIQYINVSMNGNSRISLGFNTSNFKMTVLTI